MHNSHLIGAVSKYMSKNPLMESPVNRLTNSLFNYAATPRVTNKALSQAQVYGFNTDDQKNRIDETLNSFVDPNRLTPSITEDTKNKIVHQSETLKSLVEPPITNNQTRNEYNNQYSSNSSSKSNQIILAPSVTSAINPNQEQNQNQVQTFNRQLPNEYNFYPDVIIIDKSTLIGIVIIVLFVLFAFLWIKQRNLEAQLSKYKNKSINNETYNSIKTLPPQVIYAPFPGNNQLALKSNDEVI